MVRLDENEISFPDPEVYDGHEGVIAFGGDLSIERFGLPISWEFSHGIIPERKFCGGVLIRDLFCFRRLRFQNR
jgi:hypothetical protein